MTEETPSRPPDSDDDIVQYLLTKISNLESRNTQLREQARQVELEKRQLESYQGRQDKEMKKLRSEVDRLKSPPLIIGTITDLLEDERIVIHSSAGPNFVVKASRSLDAEKLRTGTRVTLNQQSLSIIEILPPSYDSRIYGMEIEGTPTEHYGMIGGLDEQINEIREAVELALSKPELFAGVGIDAPKGVLLHGPPGTGKTLLARAVAHETQAKFLRVVGSELVQKYIGEGARLVRELFDLARENTPSIIFIDEIDAIGARRTEGHTSGDREVQRTLMQLLAELDGFESRGDVKIIAATNRLDILDDALLRPGRFDRMIEIPQPDASGRESILKIHTTRMTINPDVDLRRIATLTEEKNGADLKAICTEAGMFAIRSERTSVTNDDFIKSIAKVASDNSKTRYNRSFNGAMYA